MKREVTKIRLDCNVCGMPLTILDIGVNALGYLFVTCICITCTRGEVTMKVDTRLVAERAAHYDARAEAMIVGGN
jgi:hypothetical protein